MPILSCEESLLLMSCRAILTQDDDSRLKRILEGPLDWPFVIWRAETYQTIPLIKFHIERLGVQSALPDHLRIYIHNWAVLSEARSIEQFRELGSIINMLEELRLDYYIMKGAAISALVYPNPLIRPMQDIDIMIQPRDAWKVQKEIYKLGYRHGVFDPSSGKFTHMFRHITRRSLTTKHALHSVTKILQIPAPCPTKMICSEWRRRQIKSFVNPDGTIDLPVFVDFHVNLSAGMDLADVWRGTTRKDFLGQRVTVQSTTTMLWFSVLRLYNEAFQHGTLKLQMFGDIDTILRIKGDEIDWAEILLMADKYGAKPALFYVLRQSGKLSGSPIPNEVLALLEPRQTDLPAANDWGDVIPKLLSRPVLSDFELA